MGKLEKIALHRHAPLGDEQIKTVSILGSTGSIGKSTISIVRENPEGYKVVALTAGSNVDELINQALELKPEIAVIGDEAQFMQLKSALAGSGIEAAAGGAAVSEAALKKCDWTISAIVGIAGLKPSLAAASRGGVLALAGKESLVAAGELFLAETAKSGCRLIPVDSEHNAVFQVFDFERAERVEKITLTASGGPFLRYTKKQMESVTVEEALNHPNWKMGAKITVDSATMMNKGLELIEAYHLFPIPKEKLDVLVHPESIVHSLVHYTDGSVLAQLGMPDMRIPIAYSLSWPERMNTKSPRLDLAEIGKLTFEKPDCEKFPSLRLAKDALAKGGYAPAVLNASNEVAVNAFLAGKCGFAGIAETIEKVMEKTPSGKPSAMDEILAADAEARKYSEGEIKSLKI